MEELFRFDFIFLLFSYEFLLLFLVVLIAHMVETVTGFGSTIIVVTLCSLFLPIDRIIPIIVPVNMMLSIYIVLRYHDAVNKKILFRRIMPFVGIGVPIGLSFFFLGNNSWLKLAFGVFVVFVSSWELYRSYKREEAAGGLSLPKSAAILILGGIIHGIYASGGPMVVYYSRKVIDNKREFRSTLSVLWMVMSVILISTYIARDQISVSSIQTSGVLLIALAAGIVLGEWIYDKINENLFKTIVLILLLISGIALLINQ